MYTPDNWVKLVIVSKGETLYKILGGWSGGYLDGDYWRMNSGIASIEESDDYYDFNGYSGSVYRCYKDREGLAYSISGIYSELKDLYEDDVKIVKQEEGL